MKIRNGNQEDADACLLLTQEVTLEKQGSEEHGFLMGEESLADYAELLRNGYSLLCRDSENALLGFVIGFRKESPLFEKCGECILNASWFCSNPARDGDFFFIEKLAVAPAARRCGIARSLYTELFSRRSERVFLAGTMEAPHANLASAAFHRSLGFERVGSYEAKESEGGLGYKQGIYAKIRAASASGTSVVN
jgi:predicted GNAT superfamily acetyltransferase